MGNWIEVTIRTTTEAVEAITNILYENGAAGAMIEDPNDFKFQKNNCGRGFTYFIVSSKLG